MFVDHVFSIIKRIAQNRSQINRTNIFKFFFYVRSYGLLRTLKKINSKLKCMSSKRDILFLNNNIYQQESKHCFSDEKIIDIIIPIYNAYEYVSKCIKTVYNNTDLKYNLYLLNDCSTDVRIKTLLDKLKSISKPKNLIELIIIDNGKNVGFVRNINKGLELSSHDVVILNTDTELPQNWATRLMAPLYIDNTVASVTPFSNSATICSFPEFCKDNQLPNGIDVDELDRLFARYGGTNFIEIPTGVGFCMAMKRSAIKKIGGFDTIYGMGYGEENDWCRRAVQNGYKNVMITNLFVYHKHGASFGEIITKTKQERIDENLKILMGRYPDYESVVHDFIERDPVKDIRSFLVVIVNRLHSAREAELVINHSRGGGATAYINRRMASNPQKDYFYMELLPDGKTLRISTVNTANKAVLYFDYFGLKQDFLKKLAGCFRINRIFINELVDYPIKSIINMIMSSGIEYEYFIHDFYCVCPGITLLNYQYKYCRNENNQSICNRCIENMSINIDIKEWRSIFMNLLIGARDVVAPSNNTAKIVNSYYNDLQITVAEHGMPLYIHNTADRVQVHGNVLNVTVLGAVGIHKGSKVIKNLSDKIVRQNLPIKITIIGYTDEHPEHYKNADGSLEILGSYNNEDVSDLLAKYETDLVLFPSIWPETYSYTVSEAIYSGYKVLAFNIGASSDRIRQTKMGWLVDVISADALMCKLIELQKDKELFITGRGGLSEKS